MKVPRRLEPLRKHLREFRDYPFLKPVNAVYFLVRGQALEYCGFSKELTFRIASHVKQRRRKFTEVLWVSAPTEGGKTAEDGFIRYFKPKSNRQFRTARDVQQMADQLRRFGLDLAGKVDLRPRRDLPPCSPADLPRGWRQLGSTERELLVKLGMLAGPLPKASARSSHGYASKFTNISKSLREITKCFHVAANCQSPVLHVGRSRECITLEPEIAKAVLALAKRNT